MSKLSNSIENYILRLFHEHNKDNIELQRNELANVFRCAPSQINYVITTRFTQEKGYQVESRRGGGGYIRIFKVDLTDDLLKELLFEGISQYISQGEGEHILLRLKKEGYINSKELEILNNIINREVLDLPLPLRDEIRSNIIKVVLESIIKISSRGE
jgi:transcriptional regulator CtsR